MLSIKTVARGILMKLHDVAFPPDTHLRRTNGESTHNKHAVTSFAQFLIVSASVHEFPLYR
jgi:hypothetical protein